MKQQYIFARTKPITSDKILKTAHTVKTFDGSVYVNCLNGQFVNVNSLEKKSLPELFPKIRTVLNTNKSILAKRRNIGDLLFSGYSVKKNN